MFKRLVPQDSTGRIWLTWALALLSDKLIEGKQELPLELMSYLDDLDNRVDYLIDRIERIEQTGVS